MKDKICGCGDHTKNEDGVCDTCRMMDDDAKQEKIKREVFKEVDKEFDDGKLLDGEFTIDRAIDLAIQKTIEWKDEEMQTIISKEENLIRLEERQRTAEEIFDEIEKEIAELNKKENYSLEGKKKNCCQAELMLLKEKLKKKWAKK